VLVLNRGIDHLHSKHDIHKEEEAMVVVGPLRGCIFFVVASSVCFDGWLSELEEKILFLQKISYG